MKNKNLAYIIQNIELKQKSLNPKFYQLSTSKTKAFTLVELIVVIVILAILGTIAFISYQGYSRNSRDSVRIADVNTIKKNLGIFVVETGFYPNPDNSVSILYSGATLWNQGTVGDTVIRNIKNINKKPTDPLTQTEYTYSVANNRVEYQIGTIQENGGGGVAIFTPKTYALGDSNTVAKISGNYNERILKVNTGGLSYILAIPSIITTEIITQEVQNILDNDSLVYDGYKNIPGSYANLGYTNTGGFDYSPTDIVVYSGTTINFDDNASKIVFMTNLKNAYSGTIIGSEEVYKDILNMNPQTEQDKAVNLVNNYITTNVGGISGKITTVVFKTCTLNGQILNHNQTITTYNESSIVWNAGYNCTDRSQERICNDGILSGDELYSYTSCVKGEPTNCSANTSYTYNGHTYSIPAINHGQTATNINSQIVNISNGTQVYKLTSIGCNDGVLVNETEETNPTVTCDSGYIQSGNNCMLDVCGGNIPTNATSNATSIGYGASRSYSATAGKCTYVCNSGYTQNGASCTDQTPPTGGNFTIPSSASTTALTLTITCPTDVLGSTPIQMYISGAGLASGGNTWESCISSKNVTLTTGDGIKTITVKWRDSALNETITVSKTTTLATTASTCAGSRLTWSASVTSIPSGKRVYFKTNTSGVSQFALKTSAGTTYDFAQGGTKHNYGVDSIMISTDNGTTWGYFNKTTYPSCVVTNNYISQRGNGYNYIALSGNTAGNPDIRTDNIKSHITSSCYPYGGTVVYYCY